MKHITSMVKNVFTKKIDIFSLCVGVFVAVCVLFLGHVAFRVSTHTGWKGGMYNHRKLTTGERGAWVEKSSSPMMMDHSKMNMNPYMMSDVTSEKQFLEDMIKHHQAAVTMAEQVLKLPTLHSETKTLAEGIIKAQTREIQNMTLWLSTWK